MKKLLVILIILVSIDSHAQTFNPKQLIGTKWQRVESFSDPTIKWEFSKEEIKETVNRAILNKTASSKRKYYFSPTIPAKFDRNKVGKDEKGKYLVYYNDKSKRMSYYRIEVLSNDTLKFWHETNPEAIGDVSCYVLYKRIP